MYVRESRAIHKYISIILKARRGRIGGPDHIHFRNDSLKYIGQKIEEECFSSSQKLDPDAGKD